MKQRKRSRKDSELVQPPSLPEGFAWGREISPELLQNNQIAITPEGNPTAYLGFLDQDLNEQPFLYSVYVAAQSEQRRKARRFVELKGGGLYLSGFLFDDRPYKILEDRRIFLPSGSDNRFGVFGPNWELDERLTRHFFGATFEELEGFIRHFYSVVRQPHPTAWGVDIARITFSKTNDNNCDITNIHIPSNFPYITFTESSYFGGHISLLGFYRHIEFLCHYRLLNDDIKGDLFFQRLVDEGVKPELIVQLCQASRAHYNFPITNFYDAREIASSSRS